MAENGKINFYFFDNWAFFGSNNDFFDPELVFDFENATVRAEVAENYNLTELNREFKGIDYSINDSVP